MSPLLNLDLRPSLADDPGWTGEVDSFGGRRPVTKEAKVKESRRAAAPDTTSSFDDTFCITRARLREAGNGRFERGVPTNGQTSSTNYDQELIKIIDGEHKSLLTLGKINEAMEDDNHTGHILKHRIQLSDPNLSETARTGLLEHISDHLKKHRKKLKAVAEATEAGRMRPDITKNRGYRPGVGVLSRAIPATTYDVIPQDAHVDTERKRTAGNMAMEAKFRKFDRAVGVAYGGGGRSRRGL